MRLVPRGSGVAAGELLFPSPVRLRAGDRFVFLPTVETAVGWLTAPANAAWSQRLERALELLVAARDSRSPADLQAGYGALLEGAVREGLVFR
ncbi:hypothetical protein FHP25_29790 [Vineibacter terrae]|uniref:Uncharacterized protein n=1 Tax=Vineibacter terrae TaxID=2586908 RepID=A0A5C8PCU3_9HYPH|nr:hypothetical protein [Vineibacter terrae]TXL71569.1 hypothetical protein FHP25_29790 [Vineibacter terrae]